MLWKLIGLTGTLLFGSRWVVQFLASRRAGRSVVDSTFWLMSAGGSLSVLIYFTFGPSADCVGFVGNLLPLANAAYNLFLLGRRRAHGERTLPT